jgi:hypothetical protein
MFLFNLSSSSWWFLNVCLHELNYHFWFPKCSAMLMDYNFSCSLTNFFVMLFACTLESLLNQSNGDGTSNHWLVKLFMIVAKCCPIAHFHVIVICLWLQPLVDCCNFISCNVYNEKLALNLLLLLLLLWWFCYFCEHNGKL